MRAFGKSHVTCFQINIANFLNSLNQYIEYNQMSSNRMVPIVAVVGSVITFVSMQVFVKVLSQKISPQYIIGLCSILLFSLNFLFLNRSNLYQSYTPKDQNKHQNDKYFRLDIKNKKYFTLMIKRLFWNAAAINCFLTSLKYVHISIANALLNTTPVLTYFTERYYYKKPIDSFKLSISLISFIGVVLILNPFSHFSIENDAFNWFLLLPLVAAISNCFNWIYLHEMKEEFNEIVVLQYSYYAQLITSNLAMIIFGTMNTTKDDNSSQVFKSFAFYAQILIMVIFSYTSNYLSIKAAFNSIPSDILTFSYVGMIYSILIDILYFESSFQWTTIFGILLTSSGLLSKIFLELFTKGKPEKLPN